MNPSNMACSFTRKGIKSLSSRSNTILSNADRVSTACTVNRTFTSSASAKGRGITEKGKERARHKHDSKLRHAIDLYHVSHNFYPTGPTITGQLKIGISNGDFESNRQSSSSSFDGSWLDDGTGESDEIQLRSFDEELDWIVRANLLMIKGESHAFSSNYQSSPVSMRTDSLVLDRMEDERRKNEAPLRKTVLDITQPTNDSFTYSNGNPYGRPQRTRGNEEPLPDVNDPEAVKQYIADAVRKTALKERSSDGSAPGHTNLDSRTARLRDALFGTVQGSLPGLEVIRERSKDPRVREAAKRLINEAQEAKKRRDEQISTKEGGSDSFTKAGRAA